MLHRFEKIYVGSNPRITCASGHTANGENISYSAMLNIPEPVPPRNQFQQFRESVSTNSYHTRNQLPLITTDSRNRLQFRPIPEFPELIELIPRAEG